MPGKEVADLLAGFAPEVRNLALAARAFVLEMTPDISERVDVKARMIGYSYCQKYDRYGRHDHADQSGSKSGHCLCDELPDPKKLLEGTGKLHRHATSPPAQMASSSRDPFTRNHQAQFPWIAHLATVSLLG